MATQEHFLTPVVLMLVSSTPIMQMFSITPNMGDNEWKKNLGRTVSSRKRGTMYAKNLAVWEQKGTAGKAEIKG